MAKNFDGSLSGRTTIDKTQEEKASAYLRSNKRLNRQRQKEGEKKEKGENKEKGRKKEKGGEENENNSRNLRQQLMNAKTRKKKKNIKKKTAGKAKEKVLSPAKKATGRALRWSWLSFLPSWGLTLIYIDIHVFMHFVLSDVFCGLGEEWRIGMVDKNAEGIAKIAEIIIWALINLLVLAAIALILAIFVLLVQIVAHPYDALMTGVQMIGDLIEDTVGDIIEFFLD